MNNSRRKFLEKAPSIALAAGVGVATGNVAMASPSSSGLDGTRPLLDAVIDPSSGISFGYETTELVMKNGSSLKGLLEDKSEKELSMKLPGGTLNKVKTSDVKLIKKLNVSMMPDLHETMSKQDLADLLSYLGTLKKK